MPNAEQIVIPETRFSLYFNLMNQVIAGRISLLEFVATYMPLFQSELEKFDEEVFDVLNSVCLDCDEYVPSTDINFERLKAYLPAFTIGDDEFISRIRDAIAKLSAR